GRTKSVAVAREGELASRERAGPHVEDAIVVVGLALFSFAIVARPRRGPGVRRELLSGELDDFACFQIELEEVGTRRRRIPLAVIAQVVEIAVKDPLAVEADDR